MMRVLRFAFAAILMMIAAPAAAVDLSITATNVVPASSANINHGIAGATITAGQALYLDAADNRLKLADNNAANAALANAVGVSLNGGSTGQAIAYITAGDYNPGAAVVVGTTYILSANPGAIAPAADLATTQRLTYIGYATTTSNIRMNLKATGVQVP